MRAEDRFYIPKGVGDISNIGNTAKQIRFSMLRGELRGLYPNYYINSKEAKMVLQAMRGNLSLEEAFNSVKDKIKQRKVV